MTQYEWVAGTLVQTDNVNFEWSGGAVWCIYDATEVAEAANAIFFGCNF